MVGSSLLGHGVLRREDLSLLTGQAMFVDDFNPADLLHISFVRSTVAHALITGIDVNEAQMGEGVVGVYGSEDISILINGYSFPSSHLTVSSLGAQDFVKIA